MTSGPTVAMLAAAAGVPYHIKFGGSALLTYAPDCAAAFIAAARAAMSSGDAVCCNVPGRRTPVPDLIGLIEDVLPAAKGLITYEPAPLRVPALLEDPTIERVVGELSGHTHRQRRTGDDRAFRQRPPGGRAGRPRPPIRPRSGRTRRGRPTAP